MCNRVENTGLLPSQERGGILIGDLRYLFPAEATCCMVMRVSYVLKENAPSRLTRQQKLFLMARCTLGFSDLGL